MFSPLCVSHFAVEFSAFCFQPALMTRMDQTAGWAVNARMEAFAIVSVDASVPQGGEDRTVRSLVGVVISYHPSSFISTSSVEWNWLHWYFLYILSPHHCTAHFSFHHPPNQIPRLPHHDSKHLTHGNMHKSEKLQCDLTISSVFMIKPR